MPRYRIEIHDTDHDRIVAVRCFQEETGVDAVERARGLLPESTYGDLSVDDGTGQYVPYSVVRGAR